MTQTLHIDSLISTAAKDAGLDIGPARSALAAALGLLDRHGNPAAQTAIYDAVPGSRGLAESPEAAARRGGGLFGGLMRSAGGVSGKAMADAMGILDHLKTQGVSREDLKRLLPAAREGIRAATGRDLLGDAVRTVPGMGTLLGED